MKTINYKKANVVHIDLKGLYEGNQNQIKLLDKNLINIINLEAPITFNLLKARLREAFDIGKISQKNLDIINDRINALCFVVTEEIYDQILWPQSGIFKVDYLRINYQRQIYDIPKPEMINLVKELNLSGEELYRAILKYFGYEVLTKKALEYLKYIEE